MKRPSPNRIPNYFGASSIGLPSVRQPPLPLQEFCALQPLSPDLQPPLPLQEFWPLQACLSFAFLSAFASSWLTFPRRFDAETVLVPASKPAIAAPAIRTLFIFVILPSASCLFTFSLTAIDYYPSRQ